MSILRIVRNEAAGAWRSLRYDLDRRGSETPRPRAGYDYAGYAGYDPDTGDLARYSRPPRRLLAAGAFGVLALVGAAGTYVTVANSLDSVLHTDAAAPRSAPEIPGIPSPRPSPPPSLFAEAPAAPDATRPWTTSAHRPIPRVTTDAPARGVAAVTARPARTVEAAPTPSMPPLTGTPGTPAAPSKPGSPATPDTPGGQGASGAPGLPVPTPTSPPGSWAPSEEPDQIPDWPDWPEWPEWPADPSEAPSAPAEIPESRTPDIRNFEDECGGKHRLREGQHRRS